MITGEHMARVTVEDCIEKSPTGSTRTDRRAARQGIMKDLPTLTVTMTRTGDRAS